MFAGRLAVAETERALAAAGFDPGAPLLLAAVKSVKERRPSRTELHHRLLDRQTPAMVLGRPEVLFVLLQHDVQQFEQSLAGTGLYAGVSKPFDDPLAINVARMQAMWAVHWGPASGAPTVTAFGDSSGWMTWLPHDVETLRKIVAHTLEPLVRYDEENATQLVHTLRVFLRRERNIGRTAEELCIHKHTLQYRLRRIKEISGRSMSESQHIAELWFTFQAEALVGAPELADL